METVAFLPFSFFYVCVCVCEHAVLDSMQNFISLRMRSHIRDLFAATAGTHLPATWHLLFFYSPLLLETS